MDYKGQENPAPTDKKIILNHLGKIIEKSIIELPNKYNNIKINEYVIMPNHIHFIIEIVKNGNVEKQNSEQENCGYEGQKKIDYKGQKKIDYKGQENGDCKGQENPAPTVGNIIGYFKYQTTKEYNQLLEIKNEKYLKLWQRNYYENIIRTEKQYIKVSEYIRNNPSKWVEDRCFTKK